MKSKDYKNQIKTDKVTLNELFKLDLLNYQKFTKFGKINLLSLVIVQAQTYIASSIINKGIMPYDKFDYFPFATSRYLNHQIGFKDEINKKLFTLNFDKLKKKLRSYTPFAKISTYNLFSDFYESIKENFNKRLLFRKSTNFVPINLNYLDEQIIILDEYLKQFAKRNNIKNKKFSSNFIQYIKPYFSDEKIKIDKSNYLFVGSNAILENRIMSANYIKENRVVVSFNHANYNTLIIDEPHQEYTEHAFCNYYVDYGSIKKKPKRLKSNYLPPKEIFYMSNPNFKKKKYDHDIFHNKIIYVPDSFHGDKRHGPYRDIDDKKYYQFQKKIILANKNILVKRHPKGIRISSNSFKKKIKYIHEKNISENLSKITNQYSLFIVDRISQAFFEIASGNSKILYFNIGRRKIHKNVVNEIKKRAYVVNVDPYKISSKQISIHIKKALIYTYKKSNLMEIACLSKKKINQNFYSLFTS